jgi:subtilisin
MADQGTGSAALSEALQLTPGDLAARALQPVDVAIIDSGIDATHPDLVGRVAVSRRIEDGQVTELDTPGNNDTYGHGTGVASIVARIAPNARLIDLRVLRPGNKGSGDDLLAGLRLAVRARHPVINMSLASPAKFVPQLIPLCERAYYQDQVIIAARRNMPISDEGFPAEFASVLGVDNGDLPQPIALRYHPRRVIELEAPGDAIPVAALNGGYTTLSGTSFAAPMVSGVCALLLGAFPALRPYEVRAILCAYGLRR